MTTHPLIQFIQQHHIAAQVVKLEHEVPTVEAAAQALGVANQAIVKSVVFLADQQPVLVIACGLTRIDAKRLADYLGIARKRVRLAESAHVFEITGYVVGSVPPFGHRTPIRTLVEQTLLSQHTVYSGSGQAESVLCTTPAEIIRISQAEVVRLSDS